MVELVQSVFVFIYTVKLLKLIYSQQIVHAHAVNEHAHDHHFIVRHLPSVFQFSSVLIYLGAGIYILGEEVSINTLLYYFVALYILLEIPAQVFNLLSYLSEDVEENTRFYLNFADKKVVNKGFPWWSVIIPLFAAGMVHWNNFRKSSDSEKKDNWVFF